MAKNQMPGEMNGRPLDAAMTPMDQPTYYAKQEMYERIDREKGRIKDLGNPEGPQVAKEPIAIPGYRDGFDVRLSFALGERQSQGVLGLGVVAIGGSLVTKEEETILDEATVEWVDGKVPLQDYFIYLDVDGSITVEPRIPIPSSELFTFVHPVYLTTKVVLGRMFVSLQERVIFAIPGIQTPNTVLVGAHGYAGRATYYCEETNNDLEINAAIQYLSEKWQGGVVRLTNGQFLLSQNINLLRPSISLQGDGESTKIHGSNKTGVKRVGDYWANDDVDVETETSKPVIDVVYRTEASGIGDRTQEDVTVANQIRDLEILFVKDGNIIPVLHTAWGGDVEGGIDPQLSTDVPLRVPTIEVGDLNRAADEGTQAGSLRMYSDGSSIKMRRGGGSDWLDVIQMEQGITEPSFVIRDSLGVVKATVRVNGAGIASIILGDESSRNRVQITAAGIVFGNNTARWDGFGGLTAAGSVRGQNVYAQGTRAVLQSNDRLIVQGQSSLRGKVTVRDELEIESGGLLDVNSPASIAGQLTLGRNSNLRITNGIGVASGSLQNLYRVLHEFLPRVSGARTVLWGWAVKGFAFRSLLYAQRIGRTRIDISTVATHSQGSDSFRTFRNIATSDQRNNDGWRVECAYLRLHS